MRTDDLSISQHDVSPHANANISELRVDSLKFGILFALALTLVQRVIGLARQVLFCRILGEEQLGQWSLTWSYLMLIAPLAVLGLPGCFNRYVERYRQTGQLKAFLARIAGISFALTVLTSALLYLYAGQVSKLLYRDVEQTSLVVLMAMTLGLVVAFNFVASLTEALRQVRLVTIMRLINGVSFALLAVVFIITLNSTQVFRNGTEAVTIAFAISCLLGCLPAIWYFCRNWTIVSVSNLPLPKASMWSRVAPFAMWLWVINVVSNLYEVADRTMLLHFAPVSSREAQALVGQYHCGRVLPMVLVGLAAMLGGILMSYITASWERGEKQKVFDQQRWTIKLVGYGFTLIGVFVLLFAPVVFEYVLEGQYDAGLSVLPLTLVYCIWYCLITVGQDYVWAREQGKWACGAVGFSLILNLIFNYLLIPDYGLNGAVWATAASTFICLCILYWVNRRFGLTTDRGMWVASLIPLFLLLPNHLALVSVLLVGWAGIQYGWILDRRETDELKQSIFSLASLLGIGGFFKTIKTPA